jgi:ceramide glucosyltransferase
VILNAIFGSLALLSLALLLWQWLAARRFPLHERVSDKEFAPAVTLLKPLKGCDAATEACLRSWFAQEYAGPVQIVFGVAAADDPVCALVHKLILEFPARDARLNVCGPLLGANAKASKLVEMEKLAMHDIVVISDADVRAPPDFLQNVVAPLSPPGRHNNPGRDALPRVSADQQVGPAKREREVGLVSCFYRVANIATLAMQWEAIAINADFWSQVLQSQSLKPLDFALGAVMVTRRKHLEEIGGFKALTDCLADDYQLGNRIARKGHRIALCPVVVECWDPPMTWRAVWKHQLRWARTIRVCQPAPYFFSILSNATLWPLLWLLLAPAKGSLTIFAAVLCVRIFTALDLQSRLTRSLGHAPFLWLAPFKDLLQAGIWLCAFAGNRVEWRGRRFRLRGDGTLERI